jgi:hypothetical protein
MIPFLIALLFQSPSSAARVTRSFSVAAPSEVVATITAGCGRCDWAEDNREALLLELTVDGRYSQHLALIRGAGPADYPVMLGRLAPGKHTLTIAVDRARSASDAGELRLTNVAFKAYDARSSEFDWLQYAPRLRARPGTVEKFSDFPLVMYAERAVRGETGQHYRYQYTVIFTNEDGGTPTDRLMATWGRTTDIEFVYGLPVGKNVGEIQVEGHRWVPFAGPTEGTHPVLWVATLNNMVADHGPEDMITFAPAPMMVDLTGTSRESVMDRQPWMYSATSKEMKREQRIDPDGQPGSGKIPDPRRYGTLEACGDVADATLAFDIGVQGVDGAVRWFATDRGDSRFRIARGGCFRGGAPLPDGTTPASIVGLRVRAYPRPAREGEPAAPATGSGSVTLKSVNMVFMLNDKYVPVKSRFTWKGSLTVSTDGAPVEIR